MVTKKKTKTKKKKIDYSKRAKDFKDKDPRKMKKGTARKIAINRDRATRSKKQWWEQPRAKRSKQFQDHPYAIMCLINGYADKKRAVKEKKLLSNQLKRLRWTETKLTIVGGKK